MEITHTSLQGCFLIKTERYLDNRGYFSELFVQERYFDAGITIPLLQDNISESRKGVIRGMHFQRTQPQGKLISVLKGEIYDVMVDLRQHSTTFGQWQGVSLTANKNQQLWIPPGFAHGFQSLSEKTLVHYKTSHYYNPHDEYVFNVFDADLAISWPLTDVTLSEKDRLAPSFLEIQSIL